MNAIQYLTMASYNSLRKALSHLSKNKKTEPVFFIARALEAIGAIPALYGILRSYQDQVDQLAYVIFI